MKNINHEQLKISILEGVEGAFDKPEKYILIAIGAGVLSLLISSVSGCVY